MLIALFLVVRTLVAILVWREAVLVTDESGVFGWLPAAADKVPTRHEHVSSEPLRGWRNAMRREGQTNAAWAQRVLELLWCVPQTAVLRQ